MGTKERIFDWLAATYSADGFLRMWIALLLLCGLLHLAERVRPAERNQSYRGMLTNGAATAAYAILSPIALLASNFFVGWFISAQIRHLTGALTVIDLDALTSGYSPAARMVLLAPLVVLPLVVYDFFYYWLHRLQHTNSWLWEQHKLHHSDQALNVSTSFRVNWLEGFFKNLLVTIPMAVLLGLQPFEIGVVASATSIVTHLWGIYVHSNVRLSYGPLTAWLTGPQYHRIHHSIEPQHKDKNYVTYFPIWDVLFGSYYRPAPDEYPKTGVAGEPTNPSLREILFGPLIVWWQRIAELVGQRGRKPVAKSDVS